MYRGSPSPTVLRVSYRTRGGCVPPDYDRSSRPNYDYPSRPNYDHQSRRTPAGFFLALPHRLTAPLLHSLPVPSRCSTVSRAVLMPHCLPRRPAAPSPPGLFPTGLDSYSFSRSARCVPRTSQLQFTITVQIYSPRLHFSAIFSYFPRPFSSTILVHYSPPLFSSTIFPHHFPLLFFSTIPHSYISYLYSSAIFHTYTLQLYRIVTLSTSVRRYDSRQVIQSSPPGHAPRYVRIPETFSKPCLDGYLFSRRSSSTDISSNRTA
jgi:hypothetical protein